MEKYTCDICGYEYDPKTGDTANDVAANTAFKDVPESWVCPICNAGKDSFSEA